MVKNLRRNGAQAGFSLIELAIVMVIMGLLITPMLHEFRLYLDEKHTDDTKINMAQINSALGDFYALNGRYPCPADRTIGFGLANHGVERCTQLLALSPNSCNTNQGLCRPSNAVGPVDIGAVPYVTLKIPFSTAVDGWGNNYTYAVTETQTVKATFDATKGAVAMVDENGVSLGNMHGIIVSYGPNGAGSYNINGAAKPCQMALAESENCDNDSTFLSSLQFDASGPNYYDDMVLPSSWINSSIWTYSSADTINNTNVGNVGIGTTTPAVKLDVVGNIKADNLRSTQYCNTAGSDCMLPDVVGGAGRTCPTGQVMYAIGNNNVVCKSVAVTPTTGNCPAGQYVTAITSGGVVCAVP